MTVKTKKEAKELGNRLMNAIKPNEGWKLYIEENLGYYVYAVKGPMSITLENYHDEYKYYIYFDTSNYHLSSNEEIAVSGGYSDPNKAIRDQVKKVNAYIKKYQDALKEFECINYK